MCIECRRTFPDYHSKQFEYAECQTGVQMSRGFKVRELYKNEFQQQKVRFSGSYTLLVMSIHVKILSKSKNRYPLILMETVVLQQEQNALQNFRQLCIDNILHVEAVNRLYELDARLRFLRIYLKSSKMPKNQKCFIQSALL